MSRPIRFDTDGTLEIGDTDVDRLFASEAGSRFFWVNAAAPHTWGPAFFI